MGEANAYGANCVIRSQMSFDDHRSVKIMPWSWQQVALPDSFIHPSIFEGPIHANMCKPYSPTVVSSLQAIRSSAVFLLGLLTLRSFCRTLSLVSLGLPLGILLTTTLIYILLFTQLSSWLYLCAQTTSVYLYTLLHLLNSQLSFQLFIRDFINCISIPRRSTPHPPCHSHLQRALISLNYLPSGISSPSFPFKYSIGGHSLCLIVPNSSRAISLKGHQTFYVIVTLSRPTISCCNIKTK